MTSTPVRAASDVVSPIAWRTLFCVSVVTFMSGLEITIISLALEDIRMAFAEDNASKLSWVFTGYNIAAGALLLPAAWLGDRYGRQRVFCSGVMIFALGSLASGLAPSLDVLIAARVLQGLGAALQVPSGMAMILAAFPRSKRQSTLAYWSASAGIAAGLGPTLGALLVDQAGWRAVFLVNLPLAVVIPALASRWLLPDSPNTRVRRVDMIAVPMASIGVGVLIFGIVQTETWGWGSPKTLGTFSLALACIVWFVIRSHRHAHPLLDLSLFRLRSFSVGAIGQTAFIGAFFLWFIPLPTFLRLGWGWSVFETGLAIAPGPLLAILVAPVTGVVADAIGPRRPLVVSGLLGIIGVMLQTHNLALEPNYVSGLLIPMLFIGTAAGIAFGATTGAILAEVEERHYAIASATRSTMYQLSLALAIAVGFTIIGHPDDAAAFLDALRTTWKIATGLYATQFVFFFVFYRQREDRATEEAPSNIA